ncbi:MAG: hypothetical protein QXX81_02420 [Zestosphaera sp.]
MGECNNYRKLDNELLNIRKYCHPDAPTEYIVISKDTLPHKEYENPLMAELYGPSKFGVKISLKTLVDGREVELIKDPILDGKLEVVVRRQPRNTTLTFKEVFAILHKVEELLGVKIEWRRPFPRGSC